MQKAFGLAALGAALLAAPAAHADVTEAHVGVMAHNICVTDCKNANKEDGPNIELQVSFDTPGFLEWAWSPDPYLIASVNTAGDTSYLGFGLEWEWAFADGWALEPGFGYVVHDGETENPFTGAAAVAFADEHVLLGSEDLFRTSLALTRDLPGPWEVQIQFEHLSHGQILGDSDGHNQGLDNIGVRLGYQFGG